MLDPWDAKRMADSIDSMPDSVLVAPHKLWPASTGRLEWVWGHGLWQEPHPVMSQVLHYQAEWFAMGFTYTPRKLLDLALPHMSAWHYGQVDMGLSRLAREHGIDARRLTFCEVKHVHYQPGDDYLAWTVTSG